MVTIHCKRQDSRRACLNRSSRLLSHSLPFGMPMRLDEEPMPYKMMATAPNDNQNPGVYGAMGSITRTNKRAIHQISKARGILEVQSAKATIPTM